jgi:TonB-linked SusC/RagA family outer membrane protein
MRKLLTLLICSLLLVGNTWAQNRTITGKVLDDKKAPVSNASIIVKGTTNGTYTKEDGTFSINIQSTAKTLVISSVNFESQEVSIGKNSSFNISLYPADNKLDEVVVVGYQVQKKREVTAAISKISGDEISNMPIQSFDRAMQGRAAGVAVQSNNGIPGGPVTVRIRGIGSIQAGNEPLYIVDGVQINNSTVALNGSTGTQTNPLNFLNPNDIESIEILKDASAAAVYGARAGNGVVLITTKRGKMGKSNFTANVYWGSMSTLKLFDVLNTQEYLTQRRAALQNANPLVAAATIRATALGEMNLSSGLTDDQIAALPSYDWQREAFGTGNVFNAEMSMSGGSEKTTFYLSGSYNKTQAIVKPSDFQRGTVLMSLKHNVSKKLSVETQLNVSTVRQEATFSTDGSFLGSPTFSSSLMLPNNPIYNSNGSFYGLPSASATQPFAGILNQNIIANIFLNSNWQRTNQLVGNFKINYEIAKGLRYAGTFGMDYRLGQSDRYTDPRTPDGVGVRGRSSVNSNWNTNFLTNHVLNYSTTLKDKHNLSALAGLEYRKDEAEQIGLSGTGFATPEFRTANAAATPESITGFWSGSATFSTFAKFNYNYDAKYLFSATVRRDGSSRFGENNLFATFPAFSVGWNLSKESFINKKNFFNNLVLRASWGRTGNDQIGNFDSRGLYGGASRIYNNGSAITPSQLGNPDLRWETREEVNLGLDFAFFKNRINGSIDVYDRRNKDLLLGRPIYSINGFTSVTQNLGEVQNKGIEFALNVDVVKTTNFRWQSRFNIAYVHNELKKLYDTIKILPANNSLQVGAPLGAVFTQRYAGVNPATGRPMWFDINGNITYLPVAADRVLLNGSTILPRYTGGWTNSFQYKGFELEFFFQYEYGRIFSDGQVAFLSEIGGRSFNALRTIVDNSWKKPGDMVSWARPINGNAEVRGAGRFGGDANFRKMDYIRLKQLTFSYNLPAANLKTFGLTSARFYIQGINLWTYADWDGYDPEFTGTATGTIPQSRNTTVGLQIGF